MFENISGKPVLKHSPSSARDLEIANKYVSRVKQKSLRV